MTTLYVRSRATRRGSIRTPVVTDSDPLFASFAALCAGHAYARRHEAATGQTLTVIS